MHVGGTIDRDPQWVTMYLAAFIRVLRDRRLTYRCRLVLAVLLEGFEWGNDSSFGLSEVVERAGIARPHVSVALQTLEHLGVIERFRPGTYHFRTEVFYAGQHGEALVQRQSVDRRRRTRTRVRQTRRESRRAAAATTSV